ncbi:pyridoxamine 5'-phosphate oxidase family protein [Humibacillus xanthopallidus]|uniref:pyridoxamine 5'-phosphate oxidase family protein n=1 Tax=Humibacillus xanthopallidus TaxID=412689 RepID=UPI00384E2B63
MTSHQGDLALLQEPVAQQLLQSPSPARLAYLWTDGTPRLVPIGFHWNGSELVFGTPPDSPKTKALHDGDSVAVSIDTDAMPYHVLQIRGRVHTDTVEGLSPEYEAMSRRMMGDEAAEAWLGNLRAITSSMTRVFVTPEWVGLLDFETRFPSALERAMEQAAG